MGCSHLSFVKEVDIISIRRQEALPAKKGKKEDEETPGPKKPPRNPKKPKKGEGKGEEA